MIFQRGRAQPPTRPVCFTFESNPWQLQVASIFQESCCPGVVEEKEVFSSEPLGNLVAYIYINEG